MGTCEITDPTLAEMVKRLVDGSASDVQTLEGMIGAIPQGDLEAHPFHHLFAEAVADWRPHVKDSTAVYRDREVGS